MTMNNIIYFNEIARLIIKLRKVDLSDDEIKQMLGINYKADLDKFLK